MDSEMLNSHNFHILAQFVIVKSTGTVPCLPGYEASGPIAVLGSDHLSPLNAQALRTEAVATSIFLPRNSSLGHWGLFVILWNYEN